MRKKPAPKPKPQAAGIPDYYGHLAEQMIIDWARASYGMGVG